MAQQYKVGSTATTVKQVGMHTVVTYHATPVVQFNDHEIILDSGGYETQTTKTRMNQCANQFDLGFNVFQKKDIWYVSYLGNTHKFFDGICFARP